MFAVRVPHSVQCRAWPDGATVILNSTTGRWHALNSSGSLLWRYWQAGAGFDRGIDVLRKRYPDTAPSLIYDDAGRMLDMLLQRGLIDVEPLVTEAAVQMVREEENVEPFATTWRRRLLVVAAVAGMVLAIVGAQLPFRLVCRFMRGLRTCWQGETLSIDRATVVVGAVQRAARWFPVRSACLEQSLAAVIVAALMHQRLDWCLGAAPGPYRFHAWVEVDGHTVPTPENAQPGSSADFCRVMVL